jgi:hypothetical protein
LGREPARRWKKFCSIDRLEGAILGVSAEITRISNAPELHGAGYHFLYFG